MPKEYYIKVSEILDYCRASAKSHRELAEKCIESTGKGESQISSLGGAAYFLEQARIFEYDIPNVIKNLNYEAVESMLETPLEAMGFSTRTYNCLKRAGVDTLGGITKMYQFELEGVRNLGRKGVTEVIETLKAYGVGLKEKAGSL